MNELQLANAANGMSYFGGDDQFLDFAGDAGSFMDAVSSGKIYNLRIKNNHSTATLTALLSPGLNIAAQGLIAEGDGGFTSVEGQSGASAAGLQAYGNPFPISLFNASIQRFPTYILGFKISSTNVAQLDMPLTITREDAYQAQGSFTIVPGVYASEVNPNTGLLTVPGKFQMDNETKVSYSILPGATVVFIFVIGVQMKTTSALKNKLASIAAGQAAAQTPTR